MKPNHVFSIITIGLAMIISASQAKASDKFLQPGVWINGKNCSDYYKQYLQTKITGPKSKGAFWPGTVMVVGFHPNERKYKCHVARWNDLPAVERSVMKSCKSAHGVQPESCKVWMRVR